MGAFKSKIAGLLMDYIEEKVASLWTTSVSILVYLRQSWFIPTDLTVINSTHFHS